jgi:nitroreductase
LDAGPALGSESAVEKFGRQLCRDRRTTAVWGMLAVADCDPREFWLFRFLPVYGIHAFGQAIKPGELDRIRRCALMAMTASEVNKMKQVHAADGVLPIIHQRWSARAFADRDVAAGDLKRVFEAARWAASSNNEQPWRFVVGRRGTPTHERIFASLMGFNQAWAGKAPVLILGLAKARFSHNDAPNSYAVYDLGAASSYLTLQAAALGMTTHQMAGFDREKARKLLEIPEGYEFGSVIAMGYQGEPETLGNEELIKRETAPRTRKGLGEFVFSEWGQAMEL